jgi:hypothetical protein
MIEPLDRTFKFSTNLRLLTCFFFHFHISHNHIFAQAKDISISWHNLNYSIWIKKSNNVERLKTSCDIGLSAMWNRLVQYNNFSGPIPPGFIPNNGTWTFL